MAWNDIPDWAEKTMLSLLAALKERDPYTYGHCRRVARNAALLAKAAGLNAYEQKVIEYASIFHDLGKIAIPDRVLQKPGALTSHEERQLAHHPELGASLLDGMDIRPVDVWIRHHHEHWDGSGYPYGLEGEEIPFGSRVILVADAYDAMTTDRSYREAAEPWDALLELRRKAGVQFDPSVVAALEAHLEDMGLVAPLEGGELILLRRHVA